MLYHSVSRLCNLHHTVTRTLIMSGILCVPPTSPHKLRIIWPWIWLDTYYWIYTMPGSARTCSWTLVPPLVGRSQRKIAPYGHSRWLGHHVNSWMFYRAFFRNVSDVIPHCGTKMPSCDWSFYYVQYSLCPQVGLTQSQGLQSMVINWTPTTGLTTCQVQQGPGHGPWYRGHRKKNIRPRVWEISIRPMWSMPPPHPVYL